MGSYSRVEYRLVQQQESDSEEEETITRRVRSREEIPLRVKAGSDGMNLSLSVYNRPLFQTASLAVSMIGLTLVITTIAWVGHFKGGVSFSQTEKGIDFNWHPILMTISLIFLYGNGALIYRVIPPRNESHKLKLKLGHGNNAIGLHPHGDRSAGCFRQSQPGETSEAQHVHSAQLGGIVRCCSLRLSVDPWIPGLPVPKVLRRHPGYAFASPPVLRLQYSGVGCRCCSHGTSRESHLV